LIGGVPVAEVKKKHAGGRPPKFVDYSVVEEMAARGNTQDDIADTVDLKRQNLATRPEFHDAYKRGRVRVRNSLTSKAVEMGLAGDRTMLIFALKNLCGWRDVWDIKQEVSGNLNVNAALRKIASTDLKDIPDVTTPKG